MAALLALPDATVLQAYAATGIEPMIAYAGTGTVGYADGDRRHASFMLPLGLAVAPDGDVYVADAGAQRIRKISASGMVSTVAGSGFVATDSIFVQPGYRDGPVASARFNRPIAVAIGPDGAIYVADAGNHCIRRISQGRVSTYAGAPSRTTPTDGSNAGFADPISLAIDQADGTVYVADYGGGVRRIDSEGVTATIDVPGVTKQVRTIAVSKSGKDLILFVSADEGLCAYVVSKNEKIGFGPENDGGETGLGHATQMVALSDEELLFSDARARTVRYFNFRLHNTPFRHSYSTPLLGDERADSESESQVVRAPFGIAIRQSDGGVFFSDAGLRRVFRIPGPDRRRPVSDDISDLQRSDGHWRILYVSNSHAFTNVTWQQSPGGVVESRLARDGPRLGLRQGVTVTIARIAPSSLSGATDYIENFAADGNFDMVVLAINGPHIGNEFKDISKVSDWQPRLSSIVSALNTTLSISHTRLLVVYSPADAESTFLERSWGTEVSVGLGSSPLDFKAVEQNVDEALQRSSVPYLNAFASFAAAETLPRRAPMVGTNDGHLSRAGDSLLGNLIADRIEQLLPWKH